MYKDLNEIDEKYRSDVDAGELTIEMSTEDYIALYNLAEYSELLMREQEEEHEKRRIEDEIYAERGY